MSLLVKSVVSEKRRADMPVSRRSRSKRGPSSRRNMVSLSRPFRLDDRPDPFQKKSFFSPADKTDGFTTMLNGGYRR